jgi:hypothetical protein
MSHVIKYVFRITEPLHRDQVFKFLKDNIEDKENQQLTDLKIVDHDYYPVMQKNDITFLYSYKFDLSYLFTKLDTTYPDIDWVCELWDEEIGLCYIAQKINGIPKGWNVIPDTEDFYENLDYGRVPDILRDDYYL